MTAALCADVTLGWEPNSEAELAGYGVYLGDPSDEAYELHGYIDIQDFDDPQNPTYTVTGLTEGEVYAIVLTAYNAAGDESSYSTPVCLEVGVGPIECSSVAEGPADSAPAGGSGGGGGGGGCFLCVAAEPTQDLSSPASLATLWFFLGLAVIAGCRCVALRSKTSSSSKF